ncbi:hypothetical protein NDU88_004463 [Pleurodeles waltl]|uniref:Uncharacterized protein n=1 Tax=Pleurodeles waltl TaxID=8319 RepID=A0AAV7M6E4_PLEWA|nr:hypothetical protein NDU88_004463 [Pleurodeles waltl]
MISKSVPSIAAVRADGASPCAQSFSLGAVSKGPEISKLLLNRKETYPSITATSPTVAAITAKLEKPGHPDLPELSLNQVLLAVNELPLNFKTSPQSLGILVREIEGGTREKLPFGLQQWA